MKKLLLCISTALLAMLAGCSEGVGGGDLLTNLSGNNKIYYTTTDGEKVYLSHIGGFDSVLLSNTYKNGNGCLTFDEKVTIIGDYAFNGCENLLSIEIPDSVTSIGNYAFSGCSSLTSITIPDSVTSIGDNAFYHCSSLPIENNIRYAGTCACDVTDNTLTTYSLKENTRFIGSSLFSRCSSLTSITIPERVIAIGDNAFYYCKSLTSITIPDGVTSIGETAFYDCTSLASITIPDGVTSIGESAFYYCTSLASVYCKPTTPPSGDYQMFYRNASGRKIYVPRNSVDAYKSASYWSDYSSYIVGYDFE